MTTPTQSPPSPAVPVVIDDDKIIEIAKKHWLRKDGSTYTRLAYEHLTFERSPEMFP